MFEKNRFAKTIVKNDLGVNYEKTCLEKWISKNDFEKLVWSTKIYKKKTVWRKSIRKNDFEKCLFFILLFCGNFWPCAIRSHSLSISRKQEVANFVLTTIKQVCQLDHFQPFDAMCTQEGSRKKCNHLVMALALLSLNLW